MTPISNHAETLIRLNSILTSLSVWMTYKSWVYIPHVQHYASIPCPYMPKQNLQSKTQACNCGLQFYTPKTKLLYTYHNFHFLYEGVWCKKNKIITPHLIVRPSIDPKFHLSHPLLVGPPPSPLNTSFSSYSFHKTTPLHYYCNSFFTPKLPQG